ncbi:probable disease resistance protein At4g27220 [Durio zibethinus]|uniref:Probable disease resistance protein At4g27220 n=1 Tax=Durio zibethinus TaxID=66656 RepID=A0A6P5Y551_DURZI|nr:probable disease resistance protein At4g27220 [Durio zibethinus]
MHDVVRDFAHWIAPTGKHIFMVKDGLMEWPLRKTIVKVPNAFVKGMKALQVLYLANVIFSLEVLQFVSNLRGLCFPNCELENISSLRSMEKLEILAFSNTNIYKLPEELVALHRLKSLRFSYFSFSRKKQIDFPPNLLSRLTSLQELHIGCENNVNLSELNSLSRLTALSLSVSTAQCFPENFVFPKLQSFIIAVNEYHPFMQCIQGVVLQCRRVGSEECCHETQNIDPKGLEELTSLKLEDCNNMECLMDTTREKGPTTAFSNLVKLRMVKMTCLKELRHGCSINGFKELLCNVKKLTTDGIMHHKNLIPNVDSRGLHELTFLTLKDGKELECLIDTRVQGHVSTIPPLPNLTNLKLKSLPELKWIWKGPSHHVCLQSLKVAVISRCNK